MRPGRPRQSCQGDMTTAGKVPKPLQRLQFARDSPQATARQTICVASASRRGDQRRRTTRPTFTVRQWLAQCGKLTRSSAAPRGSRVHAGAEAAAWTQHTLGACSHSAEEQQTMAKHGQFLRSVAQQKHTHTPCEPRIIRRPSSLEPWHRKNCPRRCLSTSAKKITQRNNGNGDETQRRVVTDRPTGTDDDR
jgi:hypothetical protein